VAKSPIESMLHRALIRVCGDSVLHVSDYAATGVRMQVDARSRGAALSVRAAAGDGPATHRDWEEHTPDGDAEPRGWVVLASDVHVYGYRIDLVASLSLDAEIDRNAPMPCEAVILVECDGHEWHERTPQQAAKDRARDREILLKSGLPVVRFTGSEIVRDPDGCAKEVVDLALDSWRRAVFSSESISAYAIGHAGYESTSATKAEG
jgi:hypothetical protein